MMSFRVTCGCLLDTGLAGKGAVRQERGLWGQKTWFQSGYPGLGTQKQTFCVVLGHDLVMYHRLASASCHLGL